MSFSPRTVYRLLALAYLWVVCCLLAAVLNAGRPSFVNQPLGPVTVLTFLRLNHS